MKFVELHINNYCQYKGKNSLNLKTSPKKPINIIVGENGSGKSNLFEAIHWCLYGDKIPSNKLSNINKSRLNEVKIGDKVKMSVQIVFEDNEKEEVILTKEEISIKTSDLIGSQAAEARIDSTKYSIEYWNDGHQQKTSQFEYENFVNQYLPRNLSQFFFLDGDALLSTIKKMYKSNIIMRDHFQFLTKIHDAKQVLKNLKKWREKIIDSNKSRSKSAEIELYRKLKNRNWKDLNEYRQSKVLLTQEINEIQPEKNRLKLEVDKVKEAKKYRDKLDLMNSELSLLEERLESNLGNRRQEVIRHFPTFLMIESLKNFRGLYQLGRKDKNLPPPAIGNTEVIKMLVEEKYLKVGNRKVADIKWAKGLNKKNFIKEIKKYNKEIEKITNSDFLDRVLEGTATSLNLLNINKKEIIDNIQDSIKEGLDLEKEIKKIKEKRNTLSEKIKGSVSSDSKLLIEKYERIDQDIQRRATKIIMLDGKIEKTNRDYAVNTRNVSNFERYAKVGIGNEKRIKFIEKSIEILETSTTILTAQAINKINEIFTRILQKTDIKNDFKKATIHPDFTLEVKNAANINLLAPRPTGGSNGQKLNIAYAYMAAMKEGTGINFPILIDSPYGKLGAKLRKEITNIFINVFSDIQVSFLFHGEEYTESVGSAFYGKESNKYCIVVTDKDELGLVDSKIGDSKDFEKHLAFIKEV